MHYLSVDGKSLDASSAEMVDEHMFIYDMTQKDYMAHWFSAWNRIDTTVYKFDIGGRLFCIPSGMFVMIGDSSGSLDWIQVDESLNRGIDAVTISSDFCSWGLGEMKLVDAFEGSYYIPVTKQGLPIVSDDRILMLSNQDQHRKTKDLVAPIFTVD